MLARLTLLLCSTALFAQRADTFSFAGLSPATTLDELKARYPHSEVFDRRINVAAADAHDGISAIALGDEGSVPSMTVFFERDRGGQHVYPACDKVLSVVQARYGRPGNVVDGQEGRARNRRYEWTRAAESLTLHCFSMPASPRYAERLRITSAR